MIGNFKRTVTVFDVVWSGVFSFPFVWFVFIFALFPVQKLEVSGQTDGGRELWRYWIGNVTGSFNFVTPMCDWPQLTCVR